jgi:glycine betaine/proline transport system substrate-binding protein
MGSTRLEISKDPKGVYPKMPVQLFQEEGFKKTNLRQLLKTLILKKNSYEVMRPLQIRARQGATEWYEANKVLVDSWME